MRRYSTFLRLLDEDPVFLERVRQKILTRDLLGLPVLVAQVLDLQRQTLEALRGFMEATDRRFAAAEAQIAENGRQIAALAEQVRENGRQIASLAEQVRALTKKTDDMDRTLSRHGQFAGVAWEVDAVRALKEVLRKRGVRLRDGFRTYALPMWEVDALAPAEDERGPLWVLLEVAGRLDPGDVWKLARYLEDPDVRAVLGGGGSSASGVGFRHGCMP